MAKEDRSSRQDWKKGEVQVDVSQCSLCIFNTGPFKCMIYDVKPPEYANNSEKCPSRKY